MRKECKIKGLNPRKNPYAVRQKNQVSVDGETELGGTLLASGNDNIMNYAKGCKIVREYY